MMEIRRKRSTPRNVVAGSVWESRIKMDEVKGGIKVFNGEDSSEEAQNGNVGEAVVGDPSPINTVSEQNRTLVGVREKSRKTWKPEPIEVIGGIPIQARNTRSEPLRFSFGSAWDLNGSVDVIEKNPIQVQKSRSDSPHKDIDEPCNDVVVCKEKTISSSFSDVGRMRNRRLVFNDGGISSDEEDEREVIETEMDKKNFNDKEVDLSEQKLKKVGKAEKKLNLNNEKPMPISASLKKQSTPLRDHPIDISELKPKKVVKETRKLNTIHEKTIPISANVKKTQPRSIDQLLIDPDLKKSSPISEEVRRSPDTPKNFQMIVDLVMWRDLSKSAFVFGLGMLIIISTYCAEIMNFSFISAISYVGLIYLAAIFLYKSILCRRVKYVDDSLRIDWVREEEAIWLSKLFIPYLNEFLWKLGDLFSGDPATTMKLAVLLFVLAQCGSSITFGMIIKLGFFGVFTVPKAYSLYSESGKLLVECFWNDWDSCSYKKPLLGLLFILVWCLSTVVARIWAVFMLIVSVRYYQNSLSKVEVGKDTVRQEERKAQRQ